LAFYVRPTLPVLQAAEEYRWTDAPAADTALLRRPLLYVTQHANRELGFIKRYFSHVAFQTCIPRVWGGVHVDDFCVYHLDGFHGVPASNRLPIAYTPPPRPSLR
jgi:hypothetical protein